MGSRNGSSERSRNSSCESARSRQWRSSARRSSTGCSSIIHSGSSNGMGSAHQARSVGTCWSRGRPHDEVAHRGLEASCEVALKNRRPQLAKERRSQNHATHRAGRIRQQPCPRNRERYTVSSLRSTIGTSPPSFRHSPESPCHSSLSERAWNHIQDRKGILARRLCKKSTVFVRSVLRWGGGNRQ